MNTNTSVTVFLSAVLTMTLVAVFAVPAAVAQDPPRISHRIMEAYPEELLASIELRDRIISLQPAGPDGIAPESVFGASLRWPQTKTIKVAFLDGDSNLHKAIADAAKPWTEVCNLKLDFGLEPTTGNYRRWKESDTQYTADIRIAFDRTGYWSLVGTDSANPMIGQIGSPDGGRPNQRSMNYGKFKQALPGDFAGTVLHEFGHALGFHHEHQHPTEGCDADFRWLDDAGYIPTVDQFNQFTMDSADRRPGIYTVLGGPPNSWSKAKVDHNLKQKADSHAFTLRAFDRRSIMKYHFDTWMFTTGAASHCFGAGQNVALSPEDQISVWEQYPTDTPPGNVGGPESVVPPETPAKRIEQLEAERKKAIGVLLQVKGAPAEFKSHYESLR